MVKSLQRALQPLLRGVQARTMSGRLYGRVEKAVRLPAASAASYCRHRLTAATLPAPTQGLLLRWHMTITLRRSPTLEIRPVSTLLRGALRGALSHTWGEGPAGSVCPLVCLMLLLSPTFIIRNRFACRPTNSGKTYEALQDLRQAGSGVYAGPLRLLAWQVGTALLPAGLLGCWAAHSMRPCWPAAPVFTLAALLPTPPCQLRSTTR